MEDKHQKNCGVLREFVVVNDLLDNYSNINFSCEFEIRTEKNHQMIVCNASVSLNGYGQDDGNIKLDCNLPPEKYPTQFFCIYANNMSLDSDNNLVVEDIHTRNPIIGKYKAIITAIK